MSQNYTVQAKDTRRYITSTLCDIDGQIVATANGDGDAVPAGATLTFNKPIGTTNTTDVTVKGINGLYVTLPPDPKSGSKLIWSTEAAKWEVLPTATGYYEFVPVGKDLYWFTGQANDGVDIGPIVQVKSGGNIQHTENQWTLTKVD